MSEEEFAEGGGHRYLSYAVVSALRAAHVQMDETAVLDELDRIESRSFASLSASTRTTLIAALARQAAWQATGMLAASGIAAAGRRVGAEIRERAGDFSDLSNEDRHLMLNGCPWCGD